MMSSKKYSDLGSPEVHQRHAVMIEGGTVPRARVMDQTLIDRYLIDGLLTLQEQPQEGVLVISGDLSLFNLDVFPLTHFRCCFPEPPVSALCTPSFRVFPDCEFAASWEPLALAAFVLGV